MFITRDVYRKKITVQLLFLLDTCICIWKSQVQVLHKHVFWNCNTWMEGDLLDKDLSHIYILKHISYLHKDAFFPSALYDSEKILLVQWSFLLFYSNLCSGPYAFASFPYNTQCQHCQHFLWYLPSPFQASVMSAFWLRPHPLEIRWCNTWTLLQVLGKLCNDQHILSLAQILEVWAEWEGRNSVPKRPNAAFCFRSVDFFSLV